MKKEKVCLYVDMDGVLAKWNTNATLDEVAARGYFRRRKPQKNLIDALYMLPKEVEVKILSAVYQNGYSQNDKMAWLEENNIFFPAIFVPYGEKKKDYVEKSGVNFLLDDYSKNLFEWEDTNFCSIKFLNGINGTNGTWVKESISHNQSAERIAKELEGILCNVKS